MDFLEDLLEGFGNRKRRGYGHQDDRHRDDDDDRYDGPDARRSTIFCADCGGQLQLDFKYCPYCSKLIVHNPNTCKQCGSKLQEGSKFCPSCGGKV
ncbi:MAG: zinc ribbon domain-containing protein [Candidatus Aminicenantes bacterium]|nr:zinc ribbon domain-containing protein [Candidatus Aminicenantes bacterium]